MEIRKVLLSLVFIFCFLSQMSIKVYAAKNQYEDYTADGIRYCNSVTVTNSESNSQISYDNQGYRITLLDGDKPLYIIDLVNKYPSSPLREVCDASYGFENDLSFNLDNHELGEIFLGCIWGDNCEILHDGGYQYGVKACVTSPDDDTEIKYKIKNPKPEFYQDIDGNCLYSNTINYFPDTYKNSILYSNGTYTDDDVTTSIYSVVRMDYTDDYVVAGQSPTINTLRNTQDALFNKMQEIKGQCKLYYAENVDNRYLEHGFNANGIGFTDPSGINFSNTYKCNSRKIVTLEDFNNRYGTNIPIADRYSGSQDLFLLSHNTDNGEIKASFYDKKYINDFRFLLSVYNCFKDNMDNDGITYDPLALSQYSLMFEPIIWIYSTGVDGYYAVGDSVNGGECGWNGWHTDGDVALQHGPDPKFAFYGTLTELAFIQSTAQCDGNEDPNDMKKWNQVIGFVGKELRQFKKPGEERMRYDSGALLWSLMDIGNCCGSPMMLRSDNTDIGALHINSSNDFLAEEANIPCSNFYSFPGSSDKLLQSEYIVKNMAVAVLDYHPPITYTAQNYEYRTDTEVVTSIKLTNNNTTDFLPAYGSVAQYESLPADYAEEPVAIGAILEYTDESGNALSDGMISEAGLPDFISVQGIGASQNFDSQRSSGFEGTPSNEVYLYFKWKTPSTAQKINVTARFVGDNNKNPIYIDNNVGSIAGEILEYSGNDPNYFGKSFTTVTFMCDVKDTITQLENSNVPPDTIGGFMDRPSASASSTEMENYNKNSEVFSRYNEYYNINGVHKEFDMSEYLTDPDNEPQKIERLNWFEYSAYIDYTDNQVKLELHEYRANSWLRPQEYTSEWVTSPFKPVVIHDNVPNYNIEVSDGRYLPCIPSGYGFSFAYTEDYTGNNGIIVTDEYMETIKRSCTMFQNGVMLFPEFNYSTDDVRTIETAFDYDEDDSTFDCVHALAVNQNSKYMNGAPAIEDVVKIEDLYSRVHFIPVWFPDKTEYKIEVIMFDYWTPAGQIYDHETYTLYIDGNIYDNWYAVKSDRNQKK